ncbi:MAG: S-layer homology domain-containing protein [Bacillota bacterium]
MSKRITVLALIMAILLIFAETAFAREGICGYEGGISSGEVPGRTTLDYLEVTFITGEPVVFKGTLTIKKNQKQDKLTTTYTYSLRNAETNGTLTRTLVFETTASVSGNGQITEETRLTSARESIRINGTTYNIANINSYDFSRSNLIDPKPAIQYHAGSIWSRKVYQVGTAAEGNMVTVECTGSYYGYDQYWGNAESLVLDYIISSETNNGDVVDKWRGTASVKISCTSTEQLTYQENKPDQISFPGNYVQKRMNSSVLEYTCKLPEFDAKGVATDYFVTYRDSLTIETFPMQKSLPTVNPANIRGHWAEEEIRIMFGLEVFKGDGTHFYPDNFMSRAEFAAAMDQVAREVPQDPMLSARPVAQRRIQSKEPVISPFDDVSIENIYFSQIKRSFDRGLMNGVGRNLFGPNEGITRADAVVAFVRALGFENLAPSPYAVTTFRDNDLIPSYARNAAYVAQRIGLIQADGKGNMNPRKKITKAEGAIMFNNLIKYLQDGIRKDYRERLVNY